MNRSKEKIFLKKLKAENNTRKLGLQTSLLFPSVIISFSL